MSYNDIRPIFKRVWDHVNTFIPIGSEVGKDSSKLSERETSKTVEEEKVEEEDENPEPMLIEKKAVGIRRKTLARRRASDKQGQDNSKRQKKRKVGNGRFQVTLLEGYQFDVYERGSEDTNLEEEHAPTGETSAPPAPKTANQLAAKRNQERVKSILLLAIPDEYLLKFHNVANANSLWEAIKSRFGGNEESKKMQKNALKHQFENFSTALNEILDKSYDRF
ncbi:hypothetical protein Tco_0556446 [Tanacetum coccineum]